MSTSMYLSMYVQEKPVQQEKGAKNTACCSRIGKVVRQEKPCDLQTKLFFPTWINIMNHVKSLITPPPPPKARTTIPHLLGESGIGLY